MSRGVRAWVWPALLLGLALLAGCGFDGQTRRIDDYLLTIYSMPRQPKPGPVRIGLRVQDKHYRILTGLAIQLTLTQPQGGGERSVPMLPGPGQDFRAQIEAPLAGTYRLHIQVTLPAGQVLAADYQLPVSAR
jgi:hypothetical protein